MARLRGLRRLLATAVGLGLGATSLMAGEPVAGGSLSYHEDNPFVHAETRPSAAGALEQSIPEDATGEPPSVNPFANEVVPTNWQPATPPTPGDAPPVPPEHRLPESASSMAQAIAPWNPAPPKGIPITPPSKEYPTVRVTGFIQADAVNFNQDNANKRTVGDVPNGADFRRARLGAKGDVWENVGYRIEMDFASPGRPSFVDVFMDLRDVPWLPGTLRIGRWRQPFGMTSMTAARELFFLERPLQQALVPFRNIGVGLYDPNTKDNTTWAVSGFRFPTGPYGGNVGDSGGYSFATRETIVFGGETDTAPLLHLGGDWSYLNSSFDRFAFKSRPEVGLSQGAGALLPETGLFSIPAFVNTGILSASQTNLFGGELAGRSGSMWFQTEAYLAAVDQVNGGNSNLWGAYLMAGYILTGEVRPYSKANGVFTRVIPENPLSADGGMGAWEIAGRISTLDLTDSNVSGGQLTDVTAGLNWYLNQRTKFQFNYIHAFLDRAPVGDSDADILAARAQIDF